MINMEAIPKFDIKSVISTKLTTWIGHRKPKLNATQNSYKQNNQLIDSKLHD